MKHFYITILLVLGLNYATANEKNNLLAPSATISGPTAVCQGATNQLITFTGSGGTAPYIFTYTDPSGTQQTTLPSSGNTITIPITAITLGSLTYTLLSIRDNTNATQNQAGQVVVNVVPPFNVTAGADVLVCKGNPISLTSSVSGNGSNPVSYSWSGPNGYTSNQQSPTIPSSTALMSGNYTVTASIGNCQFQDVMVVTVAEPQIETLGGAVISNFIKCNVTNSNFTFNFSTPSYQSIIVNYAINWGDTTSGTYTSSSNPVSHSYNTGSYTISIQMNLTNGCSATKTYLVFVGSSPSPATMALFVNQANGCTPHTTQYTFNVPSTNVDGTTYVVSWGDGTADETYIHPNCPPILTHIYSVSSCGRTVVLNGITYNNVFQPTVVTQNPCSSPQPSGSGLISVGQGPSAIFTPNNNNSTPINACVNQSLQLNNTSNMGLTIPLGNGATCTNNSPFYWTISPSTAGLWTGIGLGSNNGDLNDTDNWTLGSMTPSIIFNAAGTYIITLRVKNSCGDSSFSQTFCVEPPLMPFFTPPANGCAPLIFTAINGTAPTNQCSTTNYNWHVTYAAGSCGTTITTIPDQTTTNGNFNFTEAGIYTIALTATNACTPAQTVTHTVTVRKPPIVSITTIADFCQSTAFTPASSVNTCTPNTGTFPTYLWTFPGGTSSSSVITATPPVISYATPANYSVSLAVTNECGTTTATSNNFTVQQAPIVLNETTSMCSGTSFSIIPSNTTAGNNIPVGTTYSWTIPIITGGITGGAAGNNQTSITGTLTNPTTVSQTATYTVIPKIGNCTGNPFTIIVTVNPSPTVLFSPSPQTLCSGDTSVVVNLSSAATGATFNWTAIQPTGITGVTTNGNNTIPPQTLFNSTNAPITVTYNATATTSGGSTCAGALYPYTIIVKPKPSITEAFIQTVCSGNVFTVNPTNSSQNLIPTGTTYSWSIPTVTGGMTGGASGNVQTTIIGTISNPTDIDQTATYTVTPITNGCPGTPFTITVTVKPKPVIANVAPPSICSGDTFTVTPANGGTIPSGTTYSWTISSNTNITGQSASNSPGVTSISQTLTNTSNTNQVITYTVTPVSGTCPGAIFTITVTVNPKPTIANATPPSICSGATFAFLPVNGSGNIVPTATTYTWTTPVSSPLGAIAGGNPETTGQTSINQLLTNTTNGVATLTYTVTPNSGSCPGNPFTVTVTVNPIPGTLSLTDQLYCNGIAAPAIAFSNSVMGTTYTWTNSNTAIGLPANGIGDIPAFTPTNTGSIAIIGVISLIATFNGCSGPAESFDITVISSPPVLFSPSPQSLCSGDTSTVVTLSSTATGATFSWTATQPAGVTGVITSGTNTIPVQTLLNNTDTPITVTYNATATTSSGSTCAGASYPYTIIVKPLPAITETFTNSACSGDSFTITPATSSLNVIPVGTTYSWSTPVVTGGMTGGAAGNLQTSITGVLNNPTNIDQTATYTVTPIADGCTGAVFTITITVNPKPIIGNIAPTAICSGDTFTLVPANGSGDTVPSGTTYTWTISANANITGQSASATPQTSISQTLTNNSNTSQILTYTVTPVSGSCPGTVFNITITINPRPVIANAIPPAICSGDTFVVTPINGVDIVPAGTTYTWATPISNPTGAVIGGTAQTTGQTNISQLLTNTTNDLATLTYMVTPNSGSCLGNPFTVTVTLSPLPVITSQSDTICSNNTFNVTPTNTGSNIVPTGTTYTWSAPSISPAGSITGASAQTIGQSNISQTLINTTTSPSTVVYTVTPTSGTCLGNSFTVTITVNPSISPNVVLTNNACFGVNIASITTNITGGIPFSSGPAYQITWTGPNGFTSSSTSISNISPGNYVLDILDAGNCPFQGNYTITEPADIVITVDSENDITCFNAANGSINISVTGGTGNYVYTWTKNTNPYPDTSQDISNLAPGTYVVSVTDANNCGPTTATFTITQPPLLVVSLVSQTNVLCFGAATGDITINVIGGTLGSGYIFSWTGPNGFISNTQNLNTLFAGTYDLTVTDANGCQKNLSVIITQSTDISIAYTTTPITCYGANNASFIVTLSGGNAPYLYQWSNLATTLAQTNLSAGNYTITVTDNVGCPKVLTINIPEAPVFTVNPIVSNITCFGANNGSINLNLTGGIAPVALTWSDNSTSGLIRNNLPAGTYTATISDGTPCYIVRTFTIIEPLPIVLSANTTNAFNCTNANSGAIDLIVAGGTPPFIYSWSNGATTEDLTNITSGNYLVTVTDANGCIKTAQYAITRPDPITVNVSTQTTFDCATHSVNQNFIAQASGGIPGYQFQWSSGTITGANNEIMHSNANGTILLSVTDTYGCTATQTVVVDTPVLGYPSFDTNSIGYSTYGIYAIGDPIQFQSTITGDYLSVSWNFGDGTFSTDLNPIHTYVIPKDYVVTQTVTYPFGCVYVQTITLIVEKGYLLVVPTAFTPNADGINDTFRPVTKMLKNVRLDVYDTWGSIIYSETGDVLVGWDAKIKGFNAENGNYYAKVTAETFYGTVINENQTFVLIK